MIRRWGVADAAAFRTLRLEALAAAPASFGADHDEEVELPDSVFAARLASDAVFAALAEDGAPLGMVGVQFETARKRRHLGHVWGVYVRPPARSMRIGHAILDAAIHHARGRVERVWLGVGTTNIAALALYRRAGFTIFGTEPAALRVGDVDHDEHLMTLDLRG